MQKIIGLDIGSYSVKAVEIVNTYKTYKVTGFYEKVIPEIEGLDPALLGMTALRQLFAENDLEADRIYTAMTGLHVSMRLFNLQNIKRKKDIAAIVQNELESQSPFDIENVVIDQQILDIKAGNTSVLSVLARKDYVEAYLSGLKELELEPKIIDVDYLTFMNLFPFLDFGDDSKEGDSSPGSGVGKKPGTSHYMKPCLIIDIGHQKTSLVLFNAGKLAAARTLPMGGRYFTEYLSKALGVPFNEAQRLKHSVSRVDFHPDAVAQPGQEKTFQVARKLALATSELMKELVRTIYSFRAQERIHVGAIYLTGGSSQIQNLPEYMQQFLELPVHRLAFDTTRLKIDDPALLRSHTLAQPLAVGLRGIQGKEQSKINLRRGELAFVGSYDAIFKQGVNISVLVASLLLCLMASYGLRWWLYGRQTTAFMKEYKTQVVQILGTEPRQLKSLSSNDQFEKYTVAATKLISDDLRTRENILSEFNNQSSAIPLQVLNEISKVIPKEIPMEIINFQIQDKTLTLEAETDSYGSSEKILAFMKPIAILDKLEIKDQAAKPGSDNKVLKVKFSAIVKDGV